MGDRLQELQKAVVWEGEWNWGCCLGLDSLGLSLQEILKECVAPHIADIGSVTSSASGPPQYIAKMFR